MIGREELLEQAHAFDLNQSDVQRDYLFGWMIAGIFQATSLRNSLVLKGGNALRKGYLPGTRFSGDLDFSTAHGLNSAELLRDLNAACTFVEQATGVAFDLARNRVGNQRVIEDNKTVFKARLYFKDLLAGRDHITLSIRMDVTEFDRLYLPVQERQLIHPYSDADACMTTIRCIKLEEALADKLKCLLQRRYCYDIFDLVYGAFMPGSSSIDRSELVQVFLRKTIFSGSPAAAKNLLLDLPIELFRGYWGKVLTPVVSRFSFDEAVSRLKAGVEELFAPLGLGLGSSQAFYPSKLRNPILQAGSEMRMLRLTYDGVARVVEPYSLAFKRRGDGAANEYLYVWDRTGGRSSGPGIKALFHHKIAALEVLEESFEPRFEVELSKAGDNSQAGYFSAQRNSVRTSRTSARPLSLSTLYAVQCPQCGKRFRRTKPSTKLNLHKTEYGTPCYGRFGFLA